MPKRFVGESFELIGGSFAGDCGPSAEPSLLLGLGIEGTSSETRSLLRLSSIISSLSV